MRVRVLVLWAVVLVLLLPAVALTFARVAEPDVGLWIRLEAFTPLALPLYAAAALVLGVRLAGAPPMAVDGAAVRWCWCWPGWCCTRGGSPRR